MIYIADTDLSAGTMGGVCGQLYGGTISNCCNEGNVSGKDNIGGVCGSASYGPAGDPAGSVSNCYNTANITGNNYVGGVCGYNVVPVSNCYNTGEISGASYIGGVCGKSGDYTIKDSYNSGIITGSVQYVGGICGLFSNNSGDTEDIIRCYNTGNIRNTLKTSYATSGCTGGICGQFSGNTLSLCYNTGSVSSNDTYYTGGICGKANGSLETTKISECYNSGAVTSSNDRVGGIAGLIDGCAIENCYNTGAIKGKQYVGGVWGESNSAPVKNCYNIGEVTATGTSSREPYFYPAGENDGDISNVYYNSDVNVDIYNQNPGWGRSIAQLTTETAITDLGFDTEKWSKKTNTEEYLYYPDLKNIANDNPAYSTSTPVPSGLTASAEFNSITLSWDEFSGATMYAVYYSTDGSRYELVSDTVTDTSYTITELVSGKKYYFKIRAYVSEEWTNCSNTIDVDTDYLYIRAHSLLLGDDIGVKFYIRLADSVIADENAYIKFTVNGRESDLLVSDVYYDSYYGYEFIYPVAAAEMNDIITGQLYVGGQATGDSFTYSVKTYADYILANSEEYANEVPLVNAMLNYGAAAEKYFRGSTELEFTKPDVDVSQLSAYKYTVTDNDAAYSFVGQVISLKNKVTAKLYFSGGEFTVNDFKVTQNGDEIDAKRLSVGSDTNGMYLAISGISADKMGEPFKITVGGITIRNFCVFSYVKGAINSDIEGLADVVSALYAYGCAAESYSKL
ncbi:MAG: GLUG motif-containing protein [Oscillospiraceae bacterium]